MQNVNYFGVMKYKMSKIFRVMFSSIQNAKFIVVMKPLETHFELFFASSGQNPKWRTTTFCQKILHDV